MLKETDFATGKNSNGLRCAALISSSLLLARKAQFGIRLDSFSLKILVVYKS